MTPAEKMVEFDGRLKRLEDHERKNSDLLFDNGGGIKLRLDRIERTIANRKNAFPVIMAILSALISIASLLIHVLK